jgi:hypothetical protein
VVAIQQDQASPTETEISVSNGDQFLVDVAAGLSRLEDHLHANNGLRDGRVEAYAMALDESSPIEEALEMLRKSLDEEDEDYRENKVKLLSGQCFACSIAVTACTAPWGWPAAPLSSRLASLLVPKPPAQPMFTCNRVIR